MEADILKQNRMLLKDQAYDPSYAEYIRLIPFKPFPDDANISVVKSELEKAGLSPQIDPLTCFMYIFGISYSTVKKWKDPKSGANFHPEFLDACETCRLALNAIELKKQQDVLNQKKMVVSSVYDARIKIIQNGLSSQQENDPVGELGFEKDQKWVS